MAKVKVEVPDIGGAEGAEVIEVLVAVGDQVALEQGLIVLESDKASMEIPSTAAGTVVELLVSEGEELAEGAPIAVIDSESTDGDAAADGGAGEGAPAPEPAEPPAEAEPEPRAPAAAAAQDESAPAQETTVAVPDIGTDEAVELIEVSVAPGDSVAEGDSLVVLESDKASMEVPSPLAGEVVRLLAGEGDSVRQGDPLLVMRVADSAGAAKAPPADAEQPAATAPAASGGGADQSAGPAAGTPAAGTPAAGTPAAGRPAAAPPAAGTPAAGTPAAGTPAGATTAVADTPAGGVYAGPAVRKLARELGVDLSQVRGSGPRSRILKEDLQGFVRKAVSGTPASATVGSGIPAIPEQDFSAFGPVEVVQRSKLEKLVAANMQRSWLNLPHVTHFDEADITDLEQFRAGLKQEAERRGIKMTPLPFLLKACAVALRDHPKFRSSLTEGGEKLVYKQYTHIGMAVDTPAGLVVPVIRDVDRKTLWELAAEVLELAGKARDRKLSAAEMQGGCFTISSLGNIGGTGFTPIINPPEVGILSVSRAAVKPVWDGAEFEPRNLLPLGLSYDHRVINGGDAGRFMTDLVGLLGDIRRLVL